jgi:hypothetical protein
MRPPLLIDLRIVRAKPFAPAKCRCLRVAPATDLPGRELRREAARFSQHRFGPFSE